MRRTTPWTGAAALGSAALCGMLVLAACAGARSSERSGGGARHPEIDAGLATCSECHERATPEVAARWRDGRHGLSLVACVVCHGSTGADFQARPGTAACAGCHASQVSSAAGGAQSCFACHPAHWLRAEGKPMPHPPKPREAAR